MEVFYHRLDNEHQQCFDHLSEVGHTPGKKRLYAIQTLAPIEDLNWEMDLMVKNDEHVIAVIRNSGLMIKLSMIISTR